MLVLKAAKERVKGFDIEADIRFWISELRMNYKSEYRMTVDANSTTPSMTSGMGDGIIELRKIVKASRKENIDS